MLRIIRDRVCFSILPQVRRSRWLKPAPEPRLRSRLTEQKYFGASEVIA
ncbi:MAG: hypothetical protein AAFX40_07235 [Cyanobacteria bacterium J06639_1]